jgi:hypothetical protein
LKTKVVLEVKPIVRNTVTHNGYEDKTTMDGGTLTLEVEYTIEEFLAILANQKDIILMLPSLITSIKEAIEGPAHPVADAVAKVEDAT